MDYHGTIGILAGILSFSFYLFYIFAILRGKTKPSSISWWIWTLIGVMIVISYFLSGARSTIWVPVGESIGPLVIAVLSLKYGQKSFSKLDITCLIGAIIGIILWLLFDSPFIALIAFIFSDFMGVIPTIKKVALDPSSESGVAWIFSLLGGLLNILAISTWSIAIGFYPVYMSITNTIIIAFILRKKWYYGLVN